MRILSAVVWAWLATPACSRIPQRSLLQGRIQGGALHPPSQLPHKGTMAKSMEALSWWGEDKPARPVQPVQKQSARRKSKATTRVTRETSAYRTKAETVMSDSELASLKVRGQSNVFFKSAMPVFSEGHVEAVMLLNPMYPM